MEYENETVIDLETLAKNPYIINLVKNYSDFTKGTKKVLHMIVKHFQKHSDNSLPSYEMIGKSIRLSEKTVTRAMAVFEKLNLIKKQRRAYKPNKYSFHPSLLFLDFKQMDDLKKIIFFRDLNGSKYD